MITIHFKEGRTGLAGGDWKERWQIASYLGTEVSPLGPWNSQGLIRRLVGTMLPTHRLTGNPVGGTCPPMVPSWGWFSWLLAWGSFSLSSSFRRGKPYGTCGPKSPLHCLLLEDVDGSRKPTSSPNIWVLIRLSLHRNSCWTTTA